MPIAPENIEIRTAGPGDARLLSVLASVTFYEAYFEQDDPNDVADYIVRALNVRSMSDELDDPAAAFFIVYLEGHAVGYAQLVSGSRAACITSERTIELKRIYLVERVWRRGIGDILLQHCISQARRRVDSLWLGVWQLNNRARPFYEKHGFVKVGTLEFPYGGSVGINDVMKLKLT
jgi:diamine N-acetyltransferase